MNIINFNNPIHKYFDQIASRIVGHVPIMLECGACDGTDTKDMSGILSKYHSQYRYFAFEFDPRCDKALEEVEKIPMVKVIKKAVSNIDGFVDAHLSQGAYYGSSTIKEPVAHATLWPELKFEDGKVECCKLDTFCKENDIEYIDFLYVDVEGSELDLIRGAKSMLAKTHYFHSEYLGDTFGGDSVTKESIMELLGDNWQIIEDFGTDVLLVNTGIN